MTGNDLLTGAKSVIATIAPPISEHEVIEVWLSHDMVGYRGVDGLVYRGLSKVRWQSHLRRPCS